MKFTELQSKILDLKKKKKAVILAHYYQEREIQDIADFIGDSFALARKAKNLKEDIVVVAGVYFMGETVKILNQNKQVLVPDLEAGCSLADDCTTEKFSAFIKEYPHHLKVSYVNCSAGVKALSDVVCTSSNAVKIVEEASRKGPVLFAPDQNLGAYIMKKTGVNMILWKGSCIVHEQFSGQKILNLKKQYPGSQIIAHPECAEELILFADYIGSTKQLLDFPIDSSATIFIVATEAGILHQMQKVLPGKKFIPAPLYEDNPCNCGECPYMKMNSLEKIYRTLLHETNEVKVPAELFPGAERAINEMFRIALK